jgi:hypothetical protein
MTITEAIIMLREKIKEEGIDLNELNISDDEDLIVYALNFLKDNVDSAFWEEE